MRLAVKKALLLALAGLLLLAGFVMFMIGRLEAPEVPRSTAPSPTALSNSETSEELVSAETSTSDRRAATQSNPLPTTIVPDTLPAGMRRLAGRVVIPDGTPIDERIVVCAWETSKSKEGPRAEAQRDGRFEIDVPEKWTHGWFRLESRYLYLDERFALLRCDLSAPLVLQAKLGGQIVLRVTPASAAALPLDRWVGRKGGLEVSEHTSPTSGRHVVTLEQPILGDMSCSFGGLPPSLVYEHRVQRGSLWFANHRDRSVRPAETLTLEVSAFAEARLRGTLLDEHGSRVPKAYWDFEFKSEVLRGEDADSWIGAACDEGGRFDLDGLPPGELAVRISREGLYPVCWNSGPLSEGQNRTGIELVMTTGMCIAGRVTSADGKPVRSCTVKLVPERSRNANDTCPVYYVADQTTNRDGSFEFCGLDRGPWKVEARLQSRSGTGSARAEGVAGGTRGLTLVLDETSALEGFVVDDLGAPVKEFRLRALPRADREGWSGTEGSWWEATPKEFKTADGSFALGGLHPGQWTLGIEAPGFAAQESGPHPVPSTDRSTLVLARLGSVSGRVLDARGKPVVAFVVIDRTSPTTLAPEGRTDPRVKTNDDGTFCLKQIPPGLRRIHAASPESAQSLPVVLDVPPGQQVVEVTLTLRVGGTVTGRVLDAEGRPAAGWQIGFAGPGLNSLDHLPVDANGEFSRAGLAPGAYAIAAQPPDDRKPKEWPGDSRRVWRADIRVREGETSRVVLGELLAVRGRIEGRVTRARAGVGGLRISSMGSSAPFIVDATTNDTGEFSMEVPWTGPVTVQVGSLDKNSAILSRMVALEPGRTQRADFELSSSRISGRVLDPDGSPVDGVMIGLGTRGMFQESPVSASTRTGADGAYSLEELPAGEFELEAYCTRRSYRGRPPWPELRQRVSLSEGQRLEGLDLRFRRGGRITGTVVGPHGLRVMDARPGLFDEESRLQGLPTTIVPVQNCFSDAQGRFEIPAAPPGRMLLFAATDTLVCAPIAIVVREDSTTDVRLELSPGAIVILRDSNAPDPDRTWLMDFELWDSQETNWGRLGGMLHPFPREDDGAGSGMRLGPLPRGKYRLVCHPGSGAATANSLVLDSAGPQLFELPLTR